MRVDRGDVGKVVGHVRALGLVPREAERRWDHIGAVVVDAALQPRTKYRAVVLPRVRRVIEAWPDAAELPGFRCRLDSHDLAAFLGWRPASRKLTVIGELTAVLQGLGIETVGELGACYDRGEREERTRRALRAHVAVDSHIAGFVRAAGVDARDYRRRRALIRRAAEVLACSVGALDATIWKHMSGQGNRRRVSTDG